MPTEKTDLCLPGQRINCLNIKNPEQFGFLSNFYLIYNLRQSRYYESYKYFCQKATIIFAG